MCGPLAHVGDAICEELPVFLSLNRDRQFISEIVGADRVQHLILQGRVLDFVQFHVIHKIGPALHRSLELLLVKGQQFHPAADCGLRETGLSGNFLHRVAHVHHHLESLRLLVDGQVGPLDVLHQHGAHLVTQTHVRHNAG